MTATLKKPRRESERRETRGERRVKPASALVPAPSSLVCAGAAGRVQIECGPLGVSQITFLPDRESFSRNGVSLFGWQHELAEAMEDYLNGHVIDFAEFPVDLRRQPPFRRRVLEQCRRIPYGETLAYADLANRVGNPGAVRAVGSAMSHNPVPIIIPCHRVLRSDGGLGGFSAPSGVNLKRRLLEMEQMALGRIVNAED